MTPEHQGSLPDFPDPSAGVCRFYLTIWHKDELCALVMAPSEPSLPSVPAPCLFLELFDAPEYLGPALSLSCLLSVLFPPSSELLLEDPLLWQISSWNLLAAVSINSQARAALCSDSFQTCPKNWHRLLLWCVPVLSLNSSPTGNPLIFWYFHLERSTSLRDT